jgi:hypothetical protein
MKNNFPDNWVVVFMNGDDPHYRILAGWSGGYLNGDSWQLNSGIVKVEEHDRSYYFFGTSGSCYVCGKESYGLRKNNAYIWDKLQEKFGDKVELMPEDTEWAKIDWIIK